MRVKKFMDGPKKRTEFKGYFVETLGFNPKWINNDLENNFNISFGKNFAFYKHYDLPYRSNRNRTQNKGKFGKNRKWHSYKRNQKNLWVEESDNYN